MAKSEAILRVDVSEIMKWIAYGQELMFMEMQDFSELEKIVNVNKIDLDKDEE